MQFNSGLDPDNVPAATPYQGTFGGAAGWGAAMMQAQSGGIEPTVAAATQSKLAGGPVLDQKDAQAYWQSLGFKDASFIGAGGMTKGALDVAARRQMDQLRYSRMASQSGIDRGWKFPGKLPLFGGQTPARASAEVVGGILDPANALFGSFAVAESTGKSLLMKTALTASEGAVVSEAQNVTNRTAGAMVGDQQMTADEQFKNVLFGVGFGGMFGAFGGRGKVREAQFEAPEDLRTRGESPTLPHTGAEPGVMTAGERNLAANNPGNMRMPGQSTFQQFPTLQAGIDAVGHQLDLYRRRGKDTIQQMVETYAPAKDHNNVAAYVDDVAKRTGLDPNAHLTADQIPAVRDAFIDHEQGPGWQNKHEMLTQHKPGEVTVDSATPEENTAAARAALDQFATDAKVDVEPFYTKRSALTLADEHEEMMQGLHTTAQQAVAEKLPGSMFLNENVSEDLKALASKLDIQPLPEKAPQPGKPTPSPLVAELQEHTKNAESEAQLAAEMTGGRPEALAEKLSQSDRETHEEMGNLSHDDYAKAVKAAVQCAASNGVTYAD